MRKTQPFKKLVIINYQLFHWCKLPENCAGVFTKMIKQIKDFLFGFRFDYLCFNPEKFNISFLR